MLGLSNSMYFDRFHLQLKTWQFTNILTLKGSVTCGHALYWNQGERAWPWLMQHFLNEMFPCTRMTDDEEQSETCSATNEHELPIMDYEARLLKSNKEEEEEARKASSHHGQMSWRCRLNLCVSPISKSCLRFAS
eukprot:TRINITY_DN579_c0_g1_i2.p1 TRINITY_DN579_c0_g1~~TRINITY_DN579_c0_g1_i2.p1  ORF type:complete len:135 (-),score=24.09 TRINITY_DN579_c0_g1_i2:525-929(-)